MLSLYPKNLDFMDCFEMVIWYKKIYIFILTVSLFTDGNWAFSLLINLGKKPHTVSVISRQYFHITTTFPSNPPHFILCILIFEKELTFFIENDRTEKIRYGAYTWKIYHLFVQLSNIDIFNRGWNSIALY